MTNRDDREAIALAIINNERFKEISIKFNPADEETFIYNVINCFFKAIEKGYFKVLQGISLDNFTLDDIEEGIRIADTWKKADIAQYLTSYKRQKH